MLSALIAVALFTLEVLEATKRDPSTDLQAFSDLPRYAPCESDSAVLPVRFRYMTRGRGRPYNDVVDGTLMISCQAKPTAI